MRYKHFNRSNVDVSEFAIGTWAIGGTGFGEVNEKDSIAAIRTAIDNGVNLIDTAPAYGSGYAEGIVKKAIEGYDRSKLLISTKVAIGDTTLKYAKGDHEGFVRDASFENILYECEQSLRRLGTDYVDFYFVHWPDPNTPVEETMKALNYLKEKGKIRHIGVSNFSKEQILEAEKYGQIDVIQPPFSMVVLRDTELMKWCVEKGIDTFTYGSLGAGILTGKFRTPPTFGENDPRNFFYPYFKEPMFSKVMKVIEVMDKIAAETGKPVAEIALNWTCQKDYVSTALVGASKPNHVLENVAAYSWKLSDEQMKELDEAVWKYIDFDAAG